MDQNNNTLKSIAKSLDAILDKPSDQWTQKEINIYHLLQSSLEKYKVRYSLAQFKLDVRDIKKNIKTCHWFQNSTYKKVLNWCLDQLVIKSYQHSNSTGHFRLVARFNQAMIRIEVRKSDESSKDNFEYSILHESNNISTNDPYDLDNMTRIFGIDPNISPEHRQQVVSEIASMIKEISIFYS
jgi:hypothetical protein